MICDVVSAINCRLGRFSKSVASVLLLTSSVSGHAFAQEETPATQSEPAQAENGQTQTDGNSRQDPAGDGPLTVRVTPLKKLEIKPLTAEQLKEAPVFLQDGTQITFGDWVLGALKRSDVTGQSSELDQKLFLGTVARAIAGVGVKLNEGQPLPVGEMMDGMVQQFEDNPLPQEVAVAQGILCLVFCKAVDDSASSAYGTSELAGTISAGGLSTGITGGGILGGNSSDALAFQAQFARDLTFTFADWKKRQFVVEAFDKALKEAEAAEDKP